MGTKYASARTKSEAIMDIIIGVMNGISCFGVSVVGSNHGNQKIFPTLIQYFDWKTDVKIKVIELKILPNDTAQPINTYILDTLRRHNFSNNCVAVSANNTNTNFGGLKRNTVENISFT